MRLATLAERLSIPTNDKFLTSELGLQLYDFRLQQLGRSVSIKHFRDTPLKEFAKAGWIRIAIIETRAQKYGVDVVKFALLLRALNRHPASKLATKLLDAVTY